MPRHEDEMAKRSTKTPPAEPPVTPAQPERTAAVRPPEGAATLRAFNADGEVTAVSYDGGETWHPAKGERPPVTEQLRTFDRRLAAIRPEVDATTFARRIAAPFSELYRRGIFTGWGPYAELAALPDGALSGLVIPFGSVGLDETRALARVAKTRFLDIAAPITLTPELEALLEAQLDEVDAVLVPSELIAQRLRPAHPHVFCVPPVLNPQLWGGFRRRPYDPARPLVIAVQPTDDPGLRQAIDYTRERFGAKVEIIGDDWLDRHPTREPTFYAKIDIVVAGPPLFPTQVTTQNLLGPLMAGCAIVADRAHVRAIRHGTSGLIVAKRGMTAWRQAIASVVTDARLRTHLARGARSAAQRHTAYAQLPKIAVPFDRFLPRGEPFQQAPVGFQQGERQVGREEAALSG